MVRRKKRAITLSPLEGEVMRIVWARGQVSSEDVRQALGPSRNLKDSTVRTVLRRLEAKGALTHSVDGRTFIYSAPVEPAKMAVDAVKSIVTRFCSGSVSKLLIGMADDKLVSAEQLRALADQIEEQRKKERDS